MRDIETQFRDLEEIAHIGTWRWDVATNRVTWSAELARIFGLDLEDAPSTLAEYLLLVHPEDRDSSRAQVEGALGRGEAYDSVYRIIRPNGDIRWLRSRGRVIADTDGSTRMMGVCQDVTEHKLAEVALTTMALHDTLTGLPEQALFVDRVANAIKRMARRSQSIAVLFIDLDRFKLINDTMGHAAGDEVLRAIAARLTAVLRPGDTVARVGGDEFAILCEDVSSADAIDLAQRVVGALSEPLVLDGRRAAPGVSVGVSISGDWTTTAEAMLRDADSAMYAAKRAGRNGYAVFDDAARVRDSERLLLADELQVAVDAGELRVFYQPDIDLATGVVVGVEALVRWQHPGRGLVGPEQFIRTAEDTGLVVPLGEWVLEQACREVATWPRGANHSRPLLSVNLSAAQLTQPNLTDFILRLLRETGLEPAQLCLEITESVLMEEVSTSIAVLFDLKAIGVRLAIDDFGTGYSSLSYLRRFPIDIVKIDRSFITNVGADPVGDAIVAAVVNLAHALGLDVVAEGVETDDQLVAIRALGCDRAQGHYWSPALAPGDISPWTEAAHRLAATEPVALPPLLADRADALRAATDRLVVMEIPAKLGSVMADRGALRTIFDHLLGNAVAYSADDRPIVVTGASDRKWVRVSVADYGVGMTPDESARCFEQFWQGGDPSANRARGTGMGLYIVRSLVESMGGHVAVRSAKGKGSTFTVALPRSSRAGRAPTMMPGRQKGVGEDSSIREFMRQIGVPNRRGS
jgi:diguanylate cyclase (GGDEF)-like protein/PAS domain S-box-containing protein